MNDTRHENFFALYTRWCNDNPSLAGHGSLKRFGEVVGISERQMSHLKQRRRDIGQSIARRVEQALNLPEGWLDTKHEADSPYASAAPARSAPQVGAPEATGGATSEAEARRMLVVAYRLNPELTMETLRKLYEDSLRSPG